ncbi:flavin reductase family protein [Cytobacillus sp. FSL W7-1323]|uniref:Flavin reductase n=1 Tax=Cytobacillus kochii TaxID=859143 RepID=A0A248TGP2_9BACI|nr:MULTISPECIES: flavin reductase family protein [Cytobacillus]ASV67377.1 flavin reductase [Cytobacillus kochii]MEA1854883.1 flavin reductase family protein [Cytobacillus sp. OWB-43]MED1606143.1 flavin reductase family protein [Cytobacillus kochii]
MDDRLFRNAMSKFATGVTVIATETNGNVHGMTANAFMSVSLDPKLVVISIGERANILSKIKDSGIFTVNILADDQKELSMNFAGQLKETKEVSFARLNDMPVIDGAVAQMACEVSATHVEGDHTLFIGRVKDVYLEEKDPLLFFNGKYRSMIAVEEPIS